MYSRHTHTPTRTHSHPEWQCLNGWPLLCIYIYEYVCGPRPRVRAYMFMLHVSVCRFVSPCDICRLRRLRCSTKWVWSSFTIKCDLVQFLLFSVKQWKNQQIKCIVFFFIVWPTKKKKKKQNVNAAKIVTAAAAQTTTTEIESQIHSIHYNSLWNAYSFIVWLSAAGVVFFLLLSARIYIYFSFGVEYKRHQPIIVYCLLN